MVFVTGGAFTTRARDFLERVPNPRLSKPFDVDALFAAVRSRSGLTYTAHKSSVRRARRPDPLLLPARRLRTRGRSSSARRSSGTTRSASRTATGSTGWCARSRRPRSWACGSSSDARWRSTSDPLPSRVAARRDARGLHEPLPHPHREPRAPPQGEGAARRRGRPAQPVRRAAARRACATNAAGLWCTAPPASHGEHREAARGVRRAAVHRRVAAPRRRGRRARRAPPRRSRARRTSPCARPTASSSPTRDDKPLFDVLHCIREGMTLDEAGRALLPNAEAHLRSRGAMARLFADHPAWLARSRDVADACRFSLRELEYRFPCELDAPAFPGETPDAGAAPAHVRGRAAPLARGMPPPKVAAQIEKELALVAADRASRRTSSACRRSSTSRAARTSSARGAGAPPTAPSATAWASRRSTRRASNLLFERFLSAERREPPDIDVDFEHERREEVIQAIYEKYGRDRAAMVSEVISYRGKSALREVGKAFGLSLEQVDRLSGARVVVGQARRGARRAGARVRLRPGRRARAPGARDGARHPGLPAAPVDPRRRLRPERRAARERRAGRAGDDAGSHGHPVGQGRSRHARLLQGRRPRPRDADGDPQGARSSRRDRVSHERRRAIDQLARIPPEDPAVYDALCRADTVGVFQIESRAQMAMLPRLRPRRFYDLVVEVAIVRPGPIQGGMVHPYLRRRNGEETPRSAAPDASRRSSSARSACRSSRSR